MGVDWRRALKVDQFVCVVLRVAALGMGTNRVWRVIKKGNCQRIGRSWILL